MRRRGYYNTTVDWTFEELGKNLGKCLEVTFLVEIDEPEPQTRDYPGSPGGINIYDVEINELTNDTDEVILDDSWKPVLKRIALDLGEQHLSDISESLAEERW